MRTTATMLLALLGLLIRPHVSRAGGGSAEVTISVHVEPQAEWSLPAHSQVEAGLEVLAGEEIELEQLILAFTNAKATLTWTMVRPGEPVAQPAAGTVEMISDGANAQVLDSSGGSGGVQIDPTQIWAGEDDGKARPSVSEIILTLSWL